jgi:hypothetical protein
LKEANSKPIDAKVAFSIIDSVIMGSENLPRTEKRITLDAKASSIPGKTTREGWIAFPVKGELEQAKGQVSCFQGGFSSSSRHKYSVYDVLR